MVSSQNLNLCLNGEAADVSTDAMDDAEVIDVLHAFQDRACAWGTLSNLNRAFGRVDHVNLLWKLEGYVFHGSALKMFESYLSGRV